MPSMGNLPDFMAASLRAKLPDYSASLSSMTGLTPHSSLTVHWPSNHQWCTPIYYIQYWKKYDFWFKTVSVIHWMWGLFLWSAITTMSPVELFVLRLAPSNEIKRRQFELKLLTAHLGLITAQHRVILDSSIINITNASYYAYSILCRNYWL